MSSPTPRGEAPAASERETGGGGLVRLIGGRAAARGGAPAAREQRGVACDPLVAPTWTRPAALTHTDAWEGSNRSLFAAVESHGGSSESALVDSDLGSATHRGQRREPIGHHPIRRLRLGRAIRPAADKGVR